MRTGKDRVEMSALQCPVNLGGVQVRPGDLVVGDSDGVVVLAADVVDDVFAIASDVAAKEELILEEALSGTRLREARRRHGYHTLQRSAVEPTDG
jgi:regulator of RNase E activity RraA